MRVRCPECKQIHEDPSGRFRCSGCGRALAWHVPQAWLPEQLSLFQPSGTADPLTLPFGTTSASRSAGGTDAPEPAAGQPAMDRTHRELLRDSIALVTALMPVAEGDSEIVPALLADQDAEQLLGLVATTAWLASVLVAQLDEIYPGAGTAWLQGLALGLAEEP